MNQNNKSQKFSTLGFIMSSIGAAVGLGNIWRFPKEMITSGGSSFILIYVIVLFLFVFPIFLLEFQYGLFFRKGVVSCFKNVNRKIGTFFGWKQIIITGFVCVYYLVVVSWVLVGFFNSLIPSWFQNWGENLNYFDKNILQLPNESGIGFSWKTLIAFIVLIGVIFIVISLGIKKGLEKINLFLVPGLFFLLIGLTIYSLVGKNSMIGLKKLFSFDKNSFLRPLIWYKASIQAMFSIGVMFGAFIVLSKNSNIKMDKGNDALIIVASDSFVGIISGILITTTIANSYKGEPELVSKELNNFFNSSNSGGSALVFEHLPKVFSNFNYKVLGQILFIFFIISLLFAAFSSIIVLLEVFTDSITEMFPQIGRKKVFLFWGFFAVLQYLIYILYNQKIMVDEKDKWINQFILFVGVFEVIFFIFYKDYKKVIKQNEKYTYLKMSKFNWLKRLTIFITLPLTIILCLFGFFKLFNLDYYFLSGSNEKIKDFFDIKELNDGELLKQWTSPERIFTIVIVLFMIIIPLLLTLITLKDENKIKNESKK